MTVEIETEWYTPAGRVRNVPMFSTTVENSYLGTSRTIRGSDHMSVWNKATAQLEKWAEQERRQRDVADKQDALERGEAETEELDTEAREAISAVSSLLQATLQVDDRINWDELRDKRKAPGFTFSEAPPNQPDATPRSFAPTYERHPPMPWYASFWPGAEAAWHERCAAVDLLNQSRASEAHVANIQEAARCEAIKSGHAAAFHAWTQRRESAIRQHEASVARFLEEQRHHNARVDAFKVAFERGVPAAVLEYLRGVFERSEYPSCFPVSHSVEFGDNGLATVVIEVLPLDGFPETSGYTFVRSKCEPKAVPLKKKERADLYEQAVAQTVLRTLHEIFEADYVPVVREAEVSAFISSINPRTGKAQRECTASVSASRGAFLNLDLERLDPVACVKSLSHSTLVSQ